MIEKDFVFGSRADNVTSYLRLEKRARRSFVICGLHSLLRLGKYFRSQGSIPRYSLAIRPHIQVLHRYKFSSDIQFLRRMSVLDRRVYPDT